LDPFISYEEIEADLLFRENIIITSWESLEAQTVYYIKARERESGKESLGEDTTY
jgi:hypothetical protein